VASISLPSLHYLSLLTPFPNSLFLFLRDPFLVHFIQKKIRVNPSQTRVGKRELRKESIKKGRKLKKGL